MIPFEEIPMRYLPKSDAERAAMLRDIGASSIDDLFAIIPEEYRLQAGSGDSAADGRVGDCRSL